IGDQPTLPVKLDEPFGVLPLSLFCVATPEPVTRTVPAAGTAGASVSRVSRSRPCAETAEAARRIRAGRVRMAGQSPLPQGCPSRVKPLTVPDRSDIPARDVSRSYYIHTFGCQMNESDSQRMGEALARAGWQPAAAPDAADLVLVNTCAIREKAEDKLFSALG